MCRTRMWSAGSPKKKLPTEPTMRRVWAIILRADRRMTEFVKHGTLTVGYKGEFATFVQVSNKKQASLMFNRGARIPRKFAQYSSARLSPAAPATVSRLGWATNCTSSASAGRTFRTFRPTPQ